MGDAHRVPPRVFISYSQSDSEHVDQVKEFTTQLLRESITPVIDLLAAKDYPDWLAWMDREMEEADFIVVLGSPGYLRAVAADGADESNQPANLVPGRGVRREWKRIQRLEYNRASDFRRRVLPVLLPGTTTADLPALLLDFAVQIFTVTEISSPGLSALCDRIFGRTGADLVPGIESSADFAPVALRSAPGRLGPPGDAARIEPAEPEFGLPSAFRRALTTFRACDGRRAALAVIKQWLDDPADRSSRLVTGQPGAGKTALLGVVAHLGTGRAGQVSADLPAQLRPQEDAIDLALSVRGRAPGGILDEIARAAGIDPYLIAVHEGRVHSGQFAGAQLRLRTEGVVQALRRAGSSLTVLLDGLDEITLDADGRLLPGGSPGSDSGPLATLCAGLVQPLVDDRNSPIRLLLGSRNQILTARLVRLPPNQVIDLDGGDYRDPQALRQRLESIVLGGTAAWQQLADDDLLNEVLAVLVAKAQGSFQVGETIARLEAERDDIPDVNDQGWKESIPTRAGQAMYAELCLRLGADAERAIRLLLPLAYARSAGIPWPEAWLRWAGILSRAPGPGGAETPPRADDLEWILRNATSYVVPELTGAGRQIYHLHHRALGDYLREERYKTGGHTAEADERAITRALLEGIPRLRRCRRDWKHSDHGYALSYVLQHAVAGHDEATVESLVMQDPDFLVATPEGELTSVLGGLPEPRLRLLADAVMAARSASRQDAEPGDVVNRLFLAHLSLAARRVGLRELADQVRLTENDHAPWRARWASWRPKANAQAIGASTLDNHQAVVAWPHGRFVVTGDAAGRVHRFDVLEGAVEWPPLMALDGGVLGLSVVQDSNGRHHVLVTGRDVMNRVWDLDTRTEVGPGMRIPSVVGRRQAELLAGSRGTRVLAQAGLRELWLLDPASGRKVAKPIRVGNIDSTITAMAKVGQEPENPAVVVGLDDGELFLITLGSQPEVTPLGGRGLGRPVRALACYHVHGRSRLMAGDDQGVVRFWDLSRAPSPGPTGEPVLDRQPRGVRALAGAGVNGLPVAVTVCGDNTARLWSLTTGLPIGAPFRHDCGSLAGVALVESGSRCFAVLTGAEKYPVSWELTANGPVNDPFRGHTGRIHCLITAAVGGRARVISGSDDASVRLWDLDGGGQVGPTLGGRGLDRPAGVGAGAESHHGRVAALALVRNDPEEGSPEFAPAGTTVVSGGTDGTVRWWDPQHGRPARASTDLGSAVTALLVVRAGKRERVVAATGDGHLADLDPVTGVVGRRWEAHPGGVLALALGRSPQGPCLVVSSGGDGFLRAWSLDSQAEIWTAHPGQDVRALLSLGDERVLAGAEDGSILEYRVGSNQTLAWRPALRPRPGHGSTRVTALAVLPGASVGRLVSAHGDALRFGSPGPTAHWDHGAASIRRPGAEVHSLTVGNLNGLPVVLSGGDEFTVHVWNAQGNRPMVHRGPVRAVAIASVATGPNPGPVVLSGSDDDTLQIRAMGHRNVPTAQSQREANDRLIPARAGGVRAIAVTAIGDRPVVVYGGGDGTVQVKSLLEKSWSGLLGRHGDQVRALAVTEVAGIGPVAVSASGDGSLHLWELEARRERDHWERLHDGGARCVSLALREREGTERQVVVSGGMDDTVRLRELIGRHRVGDWDTGHRGGVRALAAVPLGGAWAVISGDGHGRVLARRIPDGLLIGEVPQPAEAEISAIAARGGNDGDGIAWLTVASGRIVTVSTYEKSRGWQKHAKISFASDIHSLAIPELLEGQDEGQLGGLAVGADGGVVLLEFAPDFGPR